MSLYVVIWLVLGIIVGTYQLLGVVIPKIPTLTQTTVALVPAYVTLPFLGWLLVHFTIRYLDGSHWWILAVGITAAGAIWYFWARWG